MDTTETVNKITCELVYRRDGKKCWLCNIHSPIRIVHQINDSEAAFPSFYMYKKNGTIPSFVDNPSHPDNLVPLCYNCHAGFDITFPDWILIPDEATLRKYIEHEMMDYEERLLVSQTSRPPPRSLPLLNRSEILYHPLIITQAFTNYSRGAWPKGWMGEPTTAIHRAARHGLFESTPVRPISLGRRKWQTGVPEVFQLLVGELIRLWARKPPKRKKV